MEALVSVANRFLASITDVDEGVRGQLAHHMAHAHTCVRWAIDPGWLEQSLVG